MTNVPRLLFLAPVIFWSFCGAHALFAQQPARKIALLVGVSDYFDKGMEDLNYAENDVDAVGAELKRVGFKTAVLKGREATQRQVTAAIEKLLDVGETLESDAIVFLMFSGHGQELKTTRVDRFGNSSVEQTPFFCPRDAKPIDSESYDLRGKTESQIAGELNLVSLNSLINGLSERSNSTRNLLVVDACRNNPAKGKAAGITGSTARNLPKGISILFAAKSGQKSWESSNDEIPHGVMSHYLLKGLRGDAKNRREQITWSRLVSYVREEVEFDRGKLAGASSRRQSPHAIINDDSVIVLNTRPPKPSNWPRFRGPNGSGVNLKANIPLRWSNDANLRWKVALPGRGCSSPIVFDGKVVVSSYANGAEESVEDVRRQVCCFTLDSGSLQWKFETPAVKEKAGPWTGKYAYAMPSLCADADGIYCAFGQSGVYALDWRGKQRWKYTKEDWGRETPKGGLNALESSSPLIHGDLLIMNAGATLGALIGLEKSSGKTVWAMWGDGQFEGSKGTPVIREGGEKPEMIVLASDGVHGINPRTGEPLWLLPESITFPQGSAVEADGIFYATLPGSTVALGDSQPGEEDIEVRWSSSPGNQKGMPVAYGDHLITVRSTAITISNRDTGEQISRKRFKESASAPPAIAGSHLLILSESGACHVLDPADEYTEIATNLLGDEDEFFAGGPAVLDDCLLIRSDQFLYCISE